MRRNRCQDLTIACVLKSGGVYDARYVSHLFKQVKRHLKLPHEFVCLTDVDANMPCRRIPLYHNLPGWWSKIELFRLSGNTTIYFDLDTCIVSSIDEFALKCQKIFERDEEDLLMLRDLNYRHPHWASGILAWSKSFPWMLGACTDEMMLKHRRTGDQTYMEEMVQKRGLRVGQVQEYLNVSSYKLHCQTMIPKGTQVVCFHGYPKPHDLRGTWWEGAAA